MELDLKNQTVAMAKRLLQKAQGAWSDALQTMDADKTIRAEMVVDECTDMLIVAAKLAHQATIVAAVRDQVNIGRKEDLSGARIAFAIIEAINAEGGEDQVIFQPGTRVVIDGRPFVVQTVHADASYTVHAPRTKRVKLWMTADGWRYGRDGKIVTVTRA